MGAARSRRRAALVLMVAAFLWCGWPSAIAAQQPCPSAHLRAYSHNDYENDEPFTLAVALGYRGVEADVILVDGVLRLGQDRRDAQRGRAFEDVYLQPLRDVAARCGSLTPDGRGFLLAIEIKEASPVTYDSLVAVVNRYPDLFRPPQRDSLRPPSVDIVLVGWHPPMAELALSGTGNARIQHLVSKADFATDGASPSDTSSVVRLVSLDYGKTMGGWFTRESAKQQWLATALAIKAQVPGRLLRVFNLPADESLYRSLLAAGVDLIGTKTVRESEPLLK